ncbi:hypothetical protein LIA77_08928 [Sarocladium implicatum]|nr:hypothetical protein LIA77_08928 [Sarocladium implicatum]
MKTRPEISIVQSLVADLAVSHLSCDDIVFVLLTLNLRTQAHSSRYPTVTRALRLLQTPERPLSATMNPPTRLSLDGKSCREKVLSSARSSLQPIIASCKNVPLRGAYPERSRLEILPAALPAPLGGPCCTFICDRQ